MQLRGDLLAHGTHYASFFKHTTGIIGEPTEICQPLLGCRNFVVTIVSQHHIDNIRNILMNGTGHPCTFVIGEVRVRSIAGVLYLLDIFFEFFQWTGEAAMAFDCKPGLGSQAEIIITSEDPKKRRRFVPITNLALLIDDEGFILDVRRDDGIRSNPDRLLGITARLDGGFTSYTCPF